MAAKALHLVAPGDLASATGGYLYDREIVAGLTALGWRAHAHALDASFPLPTPAAMRDARRLFDALPARALVVVDGLALAGLGRVLDEARERLDVAALIHHPLAFETGLDTDAAARLERAEREALARVKRVIVTSQWTARALARYDVDIGKLRVVEPGFDTHARQAPRAVATPAAAGTRVQLLCVASLTPRKGHRVLLDALSELRDRDWRLACAGDLRRDPATAASVERQIDRLRLGKRVSLLGELDGASLARCYERADIFVLASFFEGYGMALAEALAYGLPIVSTTGGAIPETVPSPAGVLVPPGDDRALARALARLIDDPAERARLAAGAAAARATLPTWQAACVKFAAALDGLGSEGTGA